MPVFLDTNVLLYSIGDAPEETLKREQSRVLLERADIVLSVQVLQEFYVQATRASRSGCLDHDQAWKFVEAWLRFTIQDNTVGVLRSALDIKAKHGFSYWDSAVLAAAWAAGCTELYTEDLSHNQVVNGVRVLNPFREI